MEGPEKDQKTFESKFLKAMQVYFDTGNDKDLYQLEAEIERAIK